LYSDYALMRAIFAGFKYEASRSRLNIVSEVVFPQGSTDATVQAAQARAANPDFVIPNGAGGFDNTLTNQLLDLGFKPEQIIHPYGITTQVLGWGKRSIGSIYGTFFDHGLTELPPAGKEFLATYEKQYGRPASYIENYCYVTPYIFKAAFEQAGAVDRTKLRDALSALKMKEPTSGIPIEFNKDGARVEYIYYMQITDVEGKSYNSKQLFYTQWDPNVIPVNELVK
jgi:branched-chain amino acid transport system substrate-binding protein